MMSAQRGTVVNAHMHLVAPEWWPAEAQRPAGWSATDAERAYRANAQRLFADLRAQRDEHLDEDAVARYDDRRRRYRDARSLLAQAEVYVDEMDEAGIGLAVNLLMDHSSHPGFAGRMYVVPFERVLEDAVAVRERFPGRFVFLAGIDPRRGRDGVRLFERAVVEFGALGLGEQVYTQWRVMPDDTQLCWPYYEKALELGVPVMSDATMELGFSQPSRFRPILADFPELQLCLGGAGAGVPDDLGRRAADVMLEMAEEHPNLWLDVDDWQRPDLGAGVAARFIARALNGEAATRIMYGTDHPIFSSYWSEHDWLNALRDALEAEAVDAQGLERFFSANALSFLGRSTASS